jgi:predicted transcriptional regulator of viral defense system
MKKIEIIKILEKYPLFTFNEFVRITGKTSEYARNYLYRLKKEGLIFQIERGKYTVFDDTMIFSSHIVIPSFISFWTAFRFYNFTEQLPVDIMIASPKSKKTIDFQGTKIRFFKTKHMWGYKKQRYMDFDILVAEREKCIIDSLLMKNTIFDEIVKAIGTKEFDSKKLVEYAIKTKNKSLMKRIGYLMGKFGFETEELIKHLDNNYILLDWNGIKKGERNKKWKIIVNRRLNDIY